MKDDDVMLFSQIELKYKYKVRLFVEESMSFGTLGANGKGVSEYYDVDVRILHTVRVRVWDISTSPYISYTGIYNIS